MINVREKWNVEDLGAETGERWCIATCPECGGFIGAWLEGSKYPDSCYMSCPECLR